MRRQFIYLIFGLRNLSYEFEWQIDTCEFIHVNRVTNSKFRQFSALNMYLCSWLQQCSQQKHVRVLRYTKTKHWNCICFFKIFCFLDVGIYLTSHDCIIMSHCNTWFSIAKIEKNTVGSSGHISKEKNVLFGQMFQFIRTVKHNHKHIKVNMTPLGNNNWEPQNL